MWVRVYDWLLLTCVAFAPIVFFGAWVVLACVLVTDFACELSHC
jgi:hypothetical protein